MPPPLPKDTRSAVGVTGFRVGLALLLRPESHGWSPLHTPVAVIPLLPASDFVLVTANMPVLRLAFVLGLAWQKELTGKAAGVYRKVNVALCFLCCRSCLPGWWGLQQCQPCCTVLPGVPGRAALYQTSDQCLWDAGH